MKFFFRLLISLVFLLGTAVGLGPAILSTAWGKAVFIKTVNLFSSKTLHIDALDLSWKRSQEVKGFEILDHSGQTFFYCDRVTTDASLWQILVHRNVGEMKVAAPKIRVEPPLSRVAYAYRYQQAGFVPLPPLQAHLPIKMIGNLTIENGKVDFLSPGLDPVQLQNISLVLHLPKTGVINVSAHGEAAQAQVLGNFEIEGSFSETLKLQAHLTNFPVRSIDQSVALFEPRFSGMITSSIGEALNVDLKLDASQEDLDIALEANSAHFAAHLQTKSDNDIISLQSPAFITLKISPDLAMKFGAFPLKNNIDLTIKVEEFHLPLADKENFGFQANLAFSSVQFPETTIEPGVLYLSTPNVKEGKFSARFDSPQLSIPDIQLERKEGLVLLKPISFSGVINGSIDKLLIPEKWQNLQLEANMKWNGEGKLAIETLDHVSLNYTFSQLPSPLPTLLSQPATIEVKFDPLTSFEAVKGKALIKTLSLEELQLQNIRLLFELNRLNKRGFFDLTAGIETGEISALVTADSQAIRAKGNLKEVPTKLFELISKQKNFSGTVGKTLNFKFDISSAKEIQTLLVQGSSELVDLDLNLEQRENTLSLIKPGKISYRLTKEGYAAFTPATTPFELRDTALLNIVFLDLHLPVTIGSNKIPSLNFDPSQMQLQGDLTIDKLSFTEKNSGQTTSLNHVKFRFSQAEVSSPLSFDLKTVVEPKGALSLTGTFDHATASTLLNFNVEQFPSSFLDLAARSFTKTDVSLSTILGPTLNATIMGEVDNWTGPLKIVVNSPNVRASLEGSLKEGMLTLSEAIYAQVMMTSDLSRLILKDVNPLSITAIRADAPFTLQVLKEGFSMPLHPFAINQITIPNMRIELGQIACRNEGNVNIALGLLKLSQFSKEKELKLWFAPIDLHMKKGVVDCERTEILVANTYDICTWGQVDLVKEYVDMVLGLTASCLKKAFGIKDLPPNYVLQLSMKGAANNVQIDTGKATAKVAALLLWQQKALAGALGGGPAGALFGEIISKIGPLPDSDSKAPPAKRPFPWETSKQENKEASQTEEPKRKKHIKAGEKPLKQLLKVLK